MHQPRPIRSDCRACEKRGVIQIGGQDQPFPCPYCNAWCTFCLAHADKLPRIAWGVLVAGVLQADDSLFRGYICDIHKRNLQFSSCIGPWMMDSAQYARGTAYIVVQWECAFVVRYGIGEAMNWRDLEKDAWLAVGKQGGIRMHGGIGFALCPAALAARAAR